MRGVRAAVGVAAGVAGLAVAVLAGPSWGSSAQAASPAVVAPAAAVAGSAAQAPRPAGAGAAALAVSAHAVPAAAHRSTVTVIHIGSWSKAVEAGGQSLVNRCTVAVLWWGPMPSPASKGTSVIVGHNYCGFQRFATLKTGTLVTITGPSGTAKYRVYSHGFVGRQGGSAAGLFRGDLTLQSCEGSGTGFSYLKRVAG